jgi:hypothetical protein
VPFVRFSRDKRGYEHVYLVQAMHGQGKSAPPARVLYWYRTPPGVKVGREPFDAEARRALQAEYPNIEFDWKRITSAQIPPPEPEHPRERRRAERAMRRAQAAPERTERAETPSDSARPPSEVAVGDLPAEVAAAPDAPAVALAQPAQPQDEERRRRRRRGGRRRRKSQGPLTPGVSNAAGSAEPVELGTASEHEPPVADMSHLSPPPDDTLDREEE